MFLRPEALLLAPFFLLFLFVLGRLRRRKPIPVPSLAIWAEALQESRRFSWVGRPRSFFSELLLFAALFGLIAALALPVRRTLVHRGEDIVVVVDRSVTMATRTGGMSRFERAIATFLESLSHRTGSDRVALLSVSPGGEPELCLSFEADRRRVRSALEALEPYPYRVSVAAALRFADRLTGKPSPRTGHRGRVVLLSDSVDSEVNRWFGKESESEGGEAPARWERATGVVSDDIANVGFVGFSVSGDSSSILSGPDRGEALSETGLNLEASLRNFGNRGVDLAMRIEGVSEESQLRRIELAPSETRIVTVPLTSATEGEVGLTLEGDDDFAGDDEVRAWVGSLKPVPLSVFSSEGDADPFLAGALAACEEWIDPRASVAAGLSVFDGVGPPVGRELEGPSLWFSVPNPSLPLETGEGTFREASLAGVDSGHPVVAGLRFDHLFVEEGLEVVGVGNEARVVLQGSRGPLVVAGERGGVPFVYFAFRPSASSLPFFSSFPLLIRNCLSWFYGAPGIEVAAMAVLGQGEDSLQRPSESLRWNGVDLRGMAPAPVREGRFVEAGAFRLEDDGSEGPIVVNFLDPVASELPGRQETRSASAGFLAPVDEVRDQSWSGWCVALALALLLADWLFLSGLTPGRRRWFRSGSRRGLEVAPNEL